MSRLNEVEEIAYKSLANHDKSQNVLETCVKTILNVVKHKQEEKHKALCNNDDCEY